MNLTNFDYAYPVLIIILAIVMIVNPRTFMRKAKYDDESLKTEKIIKKIGIVLIALAIGQAIYFYYKMNA